MVVAPSGVLGHVAGLPFRPSPWSGPYSLPNDGHICLRSVIDVPGFQLRKPCWLHRIRRRCERWPALGWPCSGLVVCLRLQTRT